MIKPLIDRIFRTRVGIVLLVLFALLSVLFAAGRACQRYANPTSQFDFARTGMSDFHNGVYYPTMAFRNRINPYAAEVCTKYPMARSAPPYSPVVFFLYAPFSLLPLYAADIAFFAFNVFLMAGLAWFCVRLIRQVTDRYQSVGLSSEGWLDAFNGDVSATLFLFSWMMFSRPGHITLFTGYFTLQLVIGTVLALHFARQRPWIAALGMLLASGKPTYIIPLTILMLFRRDFRAVVLGGALCTIVGLIGIGWLASASDFSTVIEGVREGQAAFDNDPTEDPVNTWTRLDLPGVVSKVMAWKPSGTVYLAIMLALLLPIGVVLLYRDRFAKRNSYEIELHERLQDARYSGVGISAAICGLALLISIYHHSYDGLLASVVWASLLLGGKATMPEVPRWVRRVLLILLTVPAINYVATLRFREWLGGDNRDVLWNVVASSNGVCLLLALVILCVCHVVSKPRSARCVLFDGTDGEVGVSQAVR